MARNSELNDIKNHIDIINRELGDVNIKIAKIETSWTWMRWIIGANVTLWVAVMYLLMGFVGG